METEQLLHEINKYLLQYDQKVTDEVVEEWTKVPVEVLTKTGLDALLFSLSTKELSAEQLLALWVQGFAAGRIYEERRDK